MGLISGVTLENVDYSKQFEKVVIDSWCSLNEQRKHPSLCDVLIKCRSKEYYSHKSVLSVFSPYFRSLFVSDFPKTLSDGRAVCNLSDFPPACVELMLHLMYKELSFKEMEIDYMDLMALFDYIQCTSFDDILTDLVRKSINIQNCCQYLQLVTAFRRETLRHLTLVFILENFDIVIATTNFCQLPSQIITDSLKLPILQHVSYDRIMHGLKLWSGRRQNSISKSIMDIISRHWGNSRSGESSSKYAMSVRRRHSSTKNIVSVDDASSKGNLLLAYHPMNEPGKIAHMLFDSCSLMDLTSESPVEKILTTLSIHGYPAAIDEVHYEFRKGKLNAIVTMTSRASRAQHVLYANYNQCLKSFDVKFKYTFEREESECGDSSSYKPLKIVGLQYSKGNMHICIHSKDSCCILSMSLSTCILSQASYYIPNIPYDDEVFFVSLRENQSILLHKEGLVVFNLKTGAFTQHKRDRVSYMTPKYAMYNGRLYRYIHGHGLYCFDARRKDWDLLSNLTRYAVDYNRFPLIVLKNKLWLPMGSRIQARYVVYFAYDFKKNTVGQCFVFRNIDLFSPKIIALPDHIIL